MKNVLITGIGQGFGLALTKECVTRGHAVFGLLRTQENLLQFTEQERKNITPILGDVTHPSIESKIQEILGDRPLDLLVNNAGIAGRTYTLADTDLDEIHELFDVHCIGAMRVVKSAIENLLRSAEPMVINMNSRLGSIARQYEGSFKHLETSYSYRISKAAQNMFTACMHSEYGDRIRICSITPGRLKTAISQADADMLPADSAKRFVDAWEQGVLPVTAGISEIGREPLPW